MTDGRSFSNHLMKSHAAKTRDDQRTDDERHYKCSYSSARSPKRDVVEYPEKAEVPDERDKQVVQHRELAQSVMWGTICSSFTPREAFRRMTAFGCIRGASSGQSSATVA